jgi:hypothetical protein
MKDGPVDIFTMGDKFATQSRVTGLCRLWQVRQDGTFVLLANWAAEQGIAGQEVPYQPELPIWMREASANNQG